MSCRRGPHAILFYEDGAVCFEGHRDVSVKALAAEYLMLDVPSSNEPCMEIAACLATNQVDNITWHTEVFRKYIVPAREKRTSRRMKRLDLHDWFAAPVTNRIPILIHERAKKVIEDKCYFRATSAYDHRVVVASVNVETTKVDSYTEAPDKPPKRKTAIKKRMVINVRLNAKQWARVYLRCGAVVEGRFITEIVKDKSENELYVNAVEQGTGYRVRPRKLIIRRGHDGVWRIHKRVKEWI